jgi:hypothetical protein
MVHTANEPYKKGSSPGHWRRTWMHHGEAWRMPEAQPLAWAGAPRLSLGAIFVSEMRESAG